MQISLTPLPPGHHSYPMNTNTTKPRYEILDGLRGVAALMVVIFHLSEAFSYDPVYKHLNHGYLAVDFFFVLSGYVIGYAYDHRMLSGEMTRWDFVKSRLIRLQPMVLFGLLLGAAFFYLQSGNYYPRIAETSLTTLLLYVVLGFFMIPQTPEYNIRGNDELFSLNIPQWSLIYEYIANLLYGLFVYRLGKKWLAVLVAVFAVILADCALSLNMFGMLEEHDYPWALNGGFTWDTEHIYIGMARVGYSFFAGLLLSRLGLVVRARGAFWICSIIIVAIICTENVGGYALPHLDGAFSLACTLLVFPIVVCIGAGTNPKGKATIGVCRFMGRISYSLYLVHYPFVYLFFTWIDNNGDAPLSVKLFLSAAIVTVSILTAYAAMMLYDEPVRKFLRQRFLRK